MSRCVHLSTGTSGDRERELRSRRLSLATGAEEEERLTERELRLRKRQRLNSSEYPPEKSGISKIPKGKLNRKVAEEEDSDDDLETSTSEDEGYDSRKHEASKNAGRLHSPFSSSLVFIFLLVSQIQISFSSLRVHNQILIRESSLVKPQNNELAIAKASVELPFIKVSSYIYHE